MRPILLKNEPEHKVWKQCFTTPVAKARMKRKFPRTTHEVLPGFSTQEPRFHDLLRFIDEEASSRIKFGSTNGFVNESGVPRDFGIVRTLSGYGGSPSGQVLYDNAKLAEENGVASNGFRRHEHEILFRELLVAMFSYCEVKPLKVAAKSSQGLPKVSFDKQEKVRDAINLLKPANLDTLFSCHEKGEGTKLLNDTGVVIAYLQNFRLSADNPEKVRKVPSLEYAISGGQEGERVIMDKTVTIDNRIIDRIGGCRSRNVMGMSNPVNIVISAFRASTARYYLKEYEYTWHDTGLQSLIDRLQSFLDENANGVLAGIDVTQFDSNVRDWMQEAKWNILAEEGIISERFAKFGYNTGKAPVFQSDVGDGVGPVFHGDPLEMELLPSPGLLSGHDMVAPDGKFFNVWNFLCVLGETVGFREIIGKVHYFLKGQLPWKLLNAGDDGVAMFPDQATRDKFFANGSKGYFAIDIEPALTYKGYVFGLRDGKVWGANNIISLARNTWVPERPWNSKLRQYWFVGLGARYDVYNNNPSQAVLLDVFDDAVKRYYPEKGSYRGLVEYWLDVNRHNTPDARSHADALFLSSPDVIHYRVSDTEISQHLLDEEYQNIPIEHFEHLHQTDLFMKRIN